MVSIVFLCVLIVYWQCMYVEAMQVSRLGRLFAKTVVLPSTLVLGGGFVAIKRLESVPEIERRIIISTYLQKASGSALAKTGLLPPDYLVQPVSTLLSVSLEVNANRKLSFTQIRDLMFATEKILLHTGFSFHEISLICKCIKVVHETHETSLIEREKLLKFLRLIRKLAIQTEIRDIVIELKDLVDSIDKLAIK